MHGDGLVRGEGAAVVLISDNDKVVCSRRHRQLLVDGEGARCTGVGAEEDGNVVHIDAYCSDLLRCWNRAGRDLHRRGHGGPGGGRTDFDARSGR